MHTLNKYKLKHNMKRGILFLIVFISTHLLTAEVSRSQGQSDVQLKNSPAVSFKSSDNAWLVPVGVNEVHALFLEQHNCFYEIHYKSFVTFDANQDGYMDGLDQTMWEAQNGANGYSSEIFNGDSYVDGQTVWLIYNGKSYGLLYYFVLPSQPGQTNTTVKRTVPNIDTKFQNPTNDLKKSN
jgi:hypothetical protein